MAFASLAYNDLGALELGVTLPDAATLDRSVGMLQAAGLSASGAPAGVDQAAAGPGLNAAIRIEGAAR